ncbi:MAG: putative 4-hydroxybenzoate polyprenyltransferase [Gemmatimonadota bacterium]|nr:putative 4-hydroxybenzoate polyprenyltransferase [Gemmatimonadota bacterium]
MTRPSPEVPVPSPGREGQTFGGKSGVARYASLVKLPHTLFALPFALVGVTIASYATPVTVKTVAWVAVAFSAARFAAMGFNRIADRAYDALNPRTSSREIPSGTIRVIEASIAVAVAGALFFVAASRLNSRCLLLAPFALAWVLGYSYAKRFTRLAHLWLGLGLGIAPVGGYLAVTGRWSEPWWILPALAAAVACWVSGFDIFYALPDEEFDRANRLHSIPATLGRRRAIVVARLLHAGTVIALALVGFGIGAGAVYAVGVIVVAALLLYEHSLVRGGDLTKLDAAFFTMNGVISVTFFAFVLAERVWVGPR